MTIETEVMIEADRDESAAPWPMRRLMTASLVAAVVASLLAAINLADRPRVPAPPAPVAHKIRFEMIGTGAVQTTGIWLRTGDTLVPAPGTDITDLASQGLPLGVDLDYPTAGAALLQVRATREAGCRIVVDGAIGATGLGIEGQLVTCLWVETR